MKDSRALAIMLPLLVVASLAAAYFAIEAHKRGQRIDQLESQLSAIPATAKATVERTKSIQVRRVPRSVETTVFCPLCEGEAEITIEDLRNQVVGSYACPVCKARGTSTLDVPRGNDVCKECGGMGRIGVAPKEGKGGKYHARLCVKCNGKGWRRTRN